MISSNGTKFCATKCSYIFKYLYEMFYRYTGVHSVKDYIDPCNKVVNILDPARLCLCGRVSRTDHFLLSHVFNQHEILHLTLHAYKLAQFNFSAMV